MSLTNFLENAIINWLRGTNMPTAPGTLYVALFTADPGEAGGGTEAAYTGYARQPVTLSAPPSPVNNTGSVTFPVVTDAPQTIVAAALVDAASAGNQLAYDTAMVNKTVAVGDIPEFAPGALTFSID
jgi:hypothetical protein